jgi:hypothetical protein
MGFGYKFLSPFGSDIGLIKISDEYQYTRSRSCLKEISSLGQITITIYGHSETVQSLEITDFEWPSYHLAEMLHPMDLRISVVHVSRRINSNMDLFRLLLFYRAGNNR